MLIHHYIEKQAILRPNAIAIRFKDQVLSYGELNSQANKLANYLSEKQIEAGHLVGFSLERSPRLIICMLAILKVGAGYLPLDTKNPEARNTLILNNAAVRHFIIDNETKDYFTQYDGLKINIDQVSDQLHRYRQDNLERLIATTSTAYVIYTSGTTGQPNGVIIPHEHVSSLFEATRELYQFDEHDVWTLFHSYAFDFSVWEIWGALIHGATLVIVPAGVSASPVDFYDVLVREKVTVLNQTPSAFYPLIQVDASAKQALPLRKVIFGGEALSMPNLRNWLERHGDAHPELYNMYGITETTVHVTHHRITLLDLNDSHNQIGLPLSGQDIVILDEDLNPVGDEVMGEIGIIGVRIANGYLHNPTLTAERFLSHVSKTGDKVRLYRSGDLGKRLSDGRIVYLGRLDHQVKIRGYRIELGEIESALCAQPGVNLAQVLVKDKRLLAYVVTSDVAMNGHQLLKQLKLHLPNYMMPASIFCLAAFPVTPNGKIDVTALLNLEEAIFIDSDPIKLEDELISMWKKILHTSQVQLTDNFFDLGGHSLLAFECIVLISERFKVEISMLDLLDDSLSEIARKIEAYCVVPQVNQEAVYA